MANVKFLTGSKAGIDEQIATGNIDSGDIILTSDTDEMVFINPNSEKKVIKSKTQNSYTLKGTNIGALADGSTIEAGISIDDLLAMITQKSIPATYTAPTIKLSKTAGSATGNHEVGTSIGVTLSSTFTQNDAGAITAHNILKGSTNVFTGEAKNTVSAETEDFTLGEETVSFYSEASYGDGAIKNDNLGQPSPQNAIKASSVKSSAVSFTGKRAYFFGTGVGDLPTLNSATVRGLSAPQLDPKQGTTFSIPVSVGQQYIIFAYPSSLRDVNQVMYVETNDTGMAPNFTKNLINVEGANGYTAKEYKVYTYRMATPAAATMTFKVTI